MTRRQQIFPLMRISLVLLAIGITTYGALAFYQLRLNESETLPPFHVTPLPSGFESYAAIADAIRPLHEKKKPNQPGDWLDVFPEGGQTFAQYVVGRNKKPLRESFSTIYIQPLGEFDQTQLQIVAQTAEFLQSYFGVTVRSLEPRPLGDIPETARRTRNDAEQILSNWILEGCLKPQRPDDAIAVIGLVTCDLWLDDLGWVFGSASLVDRVGVWSLYRNGDPHAGDAAYRLCLKRTLKTAAHETGHMLGIPHCTAYECCMNGSRSREESDRKPIELCPECQPKLLWTCGTDAATRHRNLAEFATQHGMTKEAAFWLRQLNQLPKCGNSLDDFQSRQ